LSPSSGSKIKPNKKSAEADGKTEGTVHERIPDIGQLGLSYKTRLYMHVPPKYCAFFNLHGIKTQKTRLSIYLISCLFMFY
jgi:hypothetical protein